MKKLLVALLLSASVAHADDRTAAEERFAHAVQLYKAGDNVAALTEFRRAYELAPNFRVLYNIAQLHARLGDSAAAVLAYRRYLAEGKEEVPAKRKAEIERELAVLSRKTGTLVLKTNVPGAEVAVGSAVLGTTPITQPVVVNAGSHKITAAKEGLTPVIRNVEVSGGSELEVSLDFAEPPPGPEPKVIVAPSPSPPARVESPVPWAGWLTTGALAIGTGVMTYFALQKLDFYELEKGRFGTTADQLSARQNEARLFAGGAALLGVATVVAGGLSLSWTLSRKSEVALTPSSVTLRGTF